MGAEIKELYKALQRFIDRKQKMHIPLEQDDDDVIIANAFDELEQLREENKRLREALQSLANDIDSLINNSDGVAGLHLNGEVAPWADILPGGEFEQWLYSLEAAEKILEGGGA